MRKPVASGVLHYLSANVGRENAVVVSQTLIAKVLGVSDRSISRAIKDLEAGNWIQPVKLGSGRECAYILNSRVAWADKRDNLRLARFSAAVIVDWEDQPDRDQLDNLPPLHRLPDLFPGEQQLPSGDGLPPPSEPALPGYEPDLPAIYREG